ncbi:SGNH/GDSL hydrolase family protein [Ferrovibrio sp.]|uniref:SGNH/GDSL hydrolase family protein n=1 Tax=Ferrovibrio sp. TaxID=1917215 RepID=UPI0025B9C81C|nr:SGNH/GDSL hydrolase family protein [Ferrovibrio sp.]MBX3454271.1 SGNH/GDSL hydrolase family protein [Ferrovibrio sp.]
MNIKRLTGNLALLLASLLIGGLVIEGYFRFTSQQANHPIQATSNQYYFYQFDPVLGWSGRPGAHGVMKREEFSNHVTINANGYRQTAISAQPDIVILGDSFTWGIGVDEDDRFSDKFLAKTGFSVWNLGVSGYGPVHYLLQTDEVIRRKPKLAVIAFCLGNDFVDTVHWVRYGYFKPYAYLSSDGRLHLGGYPLPYAKQEQFRLPMVSSLFGWRPLAWLYNHSIFFQRLDIAYTELYTRADAMAQQADPRLEQALLDLRSDQDQIYHPERFGAKGEAVAHQAIATVGATMAEINHRLNVAGISLLVMTVPTKCEFDDCVRGGSERNTRARDALIGALDRAGIPWLDLLDIIEPTDFWQSDGHWRPSGHRKAAERLTAHLAEHPNLLQIRPLP